MSMKHLMKILLNYIQSITSSNEYENEALKLKNVWDHVYKDSSYTYKLEPALSMFTFNTFLIRHIRTQV